MDVWNSACGVVMSGGSRRGAMMGILSCAHPDIEEFVDCKSQPGRLTNFNISVAATDAFISAVRLDKAWPLTFEQTIYKVVSARSLWHQIMRAAYDTGEPGIIFIDRMNAKNNLYYCERIVGTNPCGEVPLPEYGACLLGSINLAAFVERPFSACAKLDETRLKQTVHNSVRFLDSAIDVSGLPLPEQRAEALLKRRIGLGITGLADALMMCGIVYGSPESFEMVDCWLRAIRDESFRASTQLSAEKGPFPSFKRDRFLEGDNVSALPSDIRDRIARDGIRNGVLNSIAPAGSISVLAENVSSGVEPIFAADVVRRVRDNDEGFREIRVTDYAVALYRQIANRSDALPTAYVDAACVNIKHHILMQSTAQSVTDGAVSKTVNVPEKLPYEEFENLYIEAFDAGCKGCTAYRPNPVRSPILRSDVARAPPDHASKRLQAKAEIGACAVCG
jgi:ribonucleoside-diphosphate reductase alpha chain